MNTNPSLGKQFVNSIGFGQRNSVEATPSMPLAAGERAVWSGTISSRLFIAIGSAMLVAGVLVIVLARSLSGTLLAIGALTVLALARVRVTVDGRGVRVGFGWPMPTKTIPVSSIEQAGAIELLPVEWGGWGYRFSRPAKGFDRTAVVLRKGDALHLTLRNGREFAVTVDDAAEAAAVVNAYVERAAATSTEI